jgi:hypothetical protein
MAERDDQLVRMIAQQVIEVLLARGASGSAGADAPAQRADIHPPIGTCTGDYSKFPELAGKLYGGGTQATGSAEESAKPQAAPKNEPIPLTGIITASQLQEALTAAKGDAIYLAPDARLTPLANDLARSHAERIKRALGGGSNPSNNVDVAALPWLWWIDGKCPVVDQVTTEHPGRLRRATAGASSSALVQVIRELAGAIRAKKIAGGFLFVHNAARATCLANRCSSIRAVVGTCGEAVEQGVNELGANVLIIEYPHHGHRSTSGMVDRMLQQGPRPPAVVERELADLHRCG